MLKPEYTNRFNVTIAQFSKDARIVFFNTVAKLDDNFEVDGNENFEVASVVMSEHTLKALYAVIGDTLAQIDKAEQQNS